MVNFLKKRLQVFVSSTYLDLKIERQAAVSAILTSGHIPAGMELFTAGDQSQMEVIKQWINESDIFLLILGSRYGSIEPKTKKSYTHLEYEYALSKKKPLFACVINESAIEERVKTLGINCIEQNNPKKLAEFRNLVLSKMSGFWSDTKDIKLEVIQTLQDFSRRDDLTGWIKGDESLDTIALTEELARLSKENANLREQNKILASQTNHVSSSNSLGISFEDMKFILESKTVKKYDFKLIWKDFFDETNNINNLLELFNILKVKLFERLDFNPGQFDYQKEKIEILEIYCQHGLIRSDTYWNQQFEAFSIEVRSFSLSESGLQFSNWLDLQSFSTENSTFNRAE